MLHLENIVEQAKQNEYFRRVLATGKNVQVVIMSIPAEGEIGTETHHNNDQTLMLVEGSGMAILDGETATFKAGDIVVVPAGIEHNFIASEETGMKIITTYSPPHHPDGTIHKTKADADTANAAKKNNVAATTAATFQAL